MDTTPITIGPEHSANATIYVAVYWQFEPYMHDVVINFVSGTSGKTISAGTLEQLRASVTEPLQRSRYYFDEASNTWKSTNYVLTNYYPDYKITTGEHRFPDREGSNDGYWYWYSSSTYNVGNLKTADATITVTLTYRYTAYQHSLIYQFIDQDGNNMANNTGAYNAVVKTYKKGNEAGGRIRLR